MNLEEDAKHGVEKEQHETEEEKMRAKKRGKGVAKVIGTKGMGEGFNRLMTMQIPLKMKDIEPPLKTKAIEQDSTLSPGYGSLAPLGNPYNIPDPVPYYGSQGSLEMLEGKKNAFNPYNLSDADLTGGLYGGQPGAMFSDLGDSSGYGMNASISYPWMYADFYKEPPVMRGFDASQ
ncbi:unnamed protein product, partial [Amoebophrya sp. A25]|eukprot:GSA25T00024908001.1